MAAGSRSAKTGSRTTTSSSISVKPRTSVSQVLSPAVFPTSIIHNARQTIRVVSAASSGAGRFGFAGFTVPLPAPSGPSSATLTVAAFAAARANLHDPARRLHPQRRVRKPRPRCWPCPRRTPMAASWKQTPLLLGGQLRANGQQMFPAPGAPGRLRAVMICSTHWRISSLVESVESSSGRPASGGVPVHFGSQVVQIVP